MRNSKGLTLVEVIASLVVLSIIGAIVVPVLSVSIRDYRERTLLSQLNTVEGALRSWTTDNINKVSCDGMYALQVPIKVLQDDAYLDYKLKNPKGGFLDDTDTFGLVYCSTIEDETKNYGTNYKYEYGAYLSIVDYEEKMAIKYAKDHNNEDTTVSTNTLKNEGYLYNNIKDLDGKNIEIPTNTLTVKVKEISDDEYKYEVSE